MSAFPPIEELLAHRGAMLLVERVIAREPSGIRVAATVDRKAWHAGSDGSMPGWIGIELMAQAIATFAGLAAHDRGERPRPGFLLGTRRYDAQCDRFAAQMTLEVSAHESFREPDGMSAFECTIVHDGRVLASATLKVFEPPDLEAFLAS